MSESDRERRRKNAIYRKGLAEGFLMGQAAAIREAGLCSEAWAGNPGDPAVAARVIAGYIEQLNIPLEEIQRRVEERALE